MVSRCQTAGRPGGQAPKMRRQHWTENGRKYRTSWQNTRVNRLLNGQNIDSSDIIACAIILALELSDKCVSLSIR